MFYLYIAPELSDLVDRWMYYDNSKGKTVFKCEFFDITTNGFIYDSTGEVHCKYEVVDNVELVDSWNVQVTINESTGHVVLHTKECEHVYQTGQCDQTEEYGYFQAERVYFDTRVWIRIGGHQ